MITHPHSNEEEWIVRSHDLNPTPNRPTLRQPRHRRRSPTSPSQLTSAVIASDEQR
jgi:hypothetical protein